MKLILTASAPPDAQGKPQPVAVDVQVLDDTGAEQLAARVHDLGKLAAMLPRVTGALAGLLSKKP